MPRPRPILAILAAALLATGVAACGDNEPEPSIPLDSAESLVGFLQEVQANVDNGSCTVAAEKVQELQSALEDLPSDVDDEVQDALEEGALNLGDLVDEQCEEPEEETTTEETTTDEEPTTEETTTEEPTTTEPTTPTQPTTPTGPDTGGGGVGPGQGGL